MDLQILWFILITVLFAVFFALEGFDYGVGMMMKFLGKSEEDKVAISKSIGPIWDGNEVWMLTAGGAMFAAFPHVYATMFSGYYIALVLMLLCLIVRVVGIELRHKTDEPSEKAMFDNMFTYSSFIIALLWGVVAVNWMIGIPIGPDKEYAGTFFNLLDPRAVLGGVASLLLALTHGGLFLSFQTEGDLQKRAIALTTKVYAPTIILVLAAALIALFTSGLSSVLGYVFAVLAIVLLALGLPTLKKGQPGKAVFMTGLSIILGTAAIFAFIFPNILISSIDVANNLTLRNASSSQYTLTIMSVVAGIFVPIVIAYQIWTYRLFLKKV